MNVKGQHAPGFYGKYPEVTWDLAEERWLGNGDRSGFVLVYCDSCDWVEMSENPVVAKPERLHVEAAIIAAQHWYECPDGDPQMECEWYGPWLQSWRAWRKLSEERWRAGWA